MSQYTYTDSAFKLGISAVMGSVNDIINVNPYAVDGSETLTIGTINFAGGQDSEYAVFETRPDDQIPYYSESRVRIPIIVPPEDPDAYVDTEYESDYFNDSYCRSYVATAPLQVGGSIIAYSDVGMKIFTDQYHLAYVDIPGRAGGYQEITFYLSEGRIAGNFEVGTIEFTRGDEIRFVVAGGTDNWYSADSSLLPMRLYDLPSGDYKDLLIRTNISSSTNDDDREVHVAVYWETPD